MAAASRKSKLPAATNARRNTKAGRQQMAPSSFALPATRSYRIDDPAHARNALVRVAQNGTPAQQAQVRKAVARKYPSIKQAGAAKHGTGKTGASKATSRKTGGKQPGDGQGLEDLLHTRLPDRSTTR